MKSYEITNNAGEKFTFFIDKEDRICLNVSVENQTFAALMMSRKESKALAKSLKQMNQTIKPLNKSSWQQKNNHSLNSL